jgi:hypothetical protein
MCYYLHIEANYFALPGNTAWSRDWCDRQVYTRDMWEPYQPKTGKQKRGKWHNYDNSSHQTPKGKNKRQEWWTNKMHDVYTAKSAKKACPEPQALSSDSLLLNIAYKHII